MPQTNLPVKTFNQEVTEMSNALVAGTSGITNLRPGSVALALLQSVAAGFIGIEQLVIHVANITRLATSTGGDVDTYVADYGLTRNPALAATTTVNLIRNLSGTAITIPVGGVVQTLVGGIQFQLIADVTQPAYNATLNAYVMTSIQTSIAATVQALVPGSAGNVLAGTITQLVSGIVGIDSVTNPSNVTNGQPQESDNALKLRFSQFISSLSKGTASAIGAAISGVQAGLTYQLGDELTPTLTALAGWFTAWVDDGSGSIPGGTLASITNAVAAVKAIGIGFSVLAPTNVTCNVVAIVTPQTGFTLGQAETAATNAITAYINTRGVGVVVNYVALEAAIAACPSVLTYSGVTINGGTSNIAIAINQLGRAGSVTVT